MSSFRSKLIFSVLSYGLVVGAIMGAVLYYLFPTYYTNWYLVILAFFLVVEPLAVLFIEQSSRMASKKPTQQVNAYIITKVVKTIIMLGAIGIYAIVVKDNLKFFALIFFILYILFLIIETILFARIEKNIKEQ